MGSEMCIRDRYTLRVGMAQLMSHSDRDLAQLRACSEHSRKRLSCYVADRYKLLVLVQPQVRCVGGFQFGLGVVAFAYVVGPHPLSVC